MKQMLEKSQLVWQKAFTSATLFHPHLFFSCPLPSSLHPGFVSVSPSPWPSIFPLQSPAPLSFIRSLRGGREPLHKPVGSLVILRLPRRTDALWRTIAAGTLELLQAHRLSCWLSNRLPFVFNTVLSAARTRRIPFFFWLWNTSRHTVFLHSTNVWPLVDPPHPPVPCRWLSNTGRKTSQTHRQNAKHVKPMVSMYIMGTTPFYKHKCLSWVIFYLSRLHTSPLMWWAIPQIPIPIKTIDR